MFKLKLQSCGLIKPDPLRTLQLEKNHILNSSLVTPNCKQYVSRYSPRCISLLQSASLQRKSDIYSLPRQIKLIETLAPNNEKNRYLDGYEQSEYFNNKN